MGKFKILSTLMEHIVEIGGGGVIQRYLGCYVFVYFGNNIWYKDIVTGIYNSPVMLEMKNNSNKSIRNIRKKCVQVKSEYLYIKQLFSNLQLVVV